LWGPYKRCAELLLDNPQLTEANVYIGENYTRLLKANNSLVKELVKDPALSNLPSETIKAIINVAGRNRMLSQRIGLMVFKILQGDKSLIPFLAKTISLHDNSFNILVNGGTLEGESIVFPKISPSLLKEVNEVRQVWIPFKQHAEVVVAAKEYLECIEVISNNYTGLLKQNNALVQAIAFETKREKEETNKLLNTTLITLLLITIIIILLGYVGINKLIVIPIRKITKQMESLSFGEIPSVKKLERKDEVGALNNSLNKLVINIKSYSKFTGEIGQGNFEYKFTAASEDDELGKSLISMREKLKSVEEESLSRNWKTEGLAKFADVLRASHLDLEEFSQDIIANVVQYIDAVQGAIFIVNNKDSENILIERKGSYAYGRSKFVDGFVKPGEGMVGQVYLEKKHIFLTDIPADYMKITSGLGEAEPASVLILPLLINDDVFGIIELASFNTFTNLQVDFLCSLCESIASTINSARVNENTKSLLIESKTMEENLQSQEEELRQTMEEMQATQDSMEEREQEFRDEIKKLNQEISKIKG
jgi:nitrate/nitrite-specific signal transduction histidine kinase